MNSSEPVQLENYKISQFGEPYLHSISRNNFEKNTASVVFQQHFGQRLEEESFLYIVLGTDGGLLVDHLLEQGLPYNSKFIFIDLPEVLETLSAHLSFTHWDDNIALCTMDNWLAQAEVFKIHAYLFTSKVKYIKSIAAIDAFESRYHDLDAELAIALESLDHKTKASLSRAPFIKRQIENFSENNHPFSDLYDLFLGKQAIVIGGGPSLDQHIKWLQEHQEQLVIIAVSRVAKRLINENITPHFVISVDPHDISFDVSKELLELPKSTIFIHSNYVVSLLSAQWHGQHFYLGSRSPWEVIEEIANADIQGPTVTNAAIGIAIKLGVDKIYLSGVDLCFAANGMTHAQGSNEAKVGPRLGFKGQWVENYLGQRVETYTSFLNASFVLNEQAKQAKENHNCEIINLSDSAVKLDNIPCMKTSAVEVQISNDINEFIADNVKSNEQDANKLNKHTLDYIERLLKELSDIYQISKSALKDNEALYKAEGNERKQAQIKQKIDKAEKKLEGRHEKTSIFIKKYGIQSFIKVVRTDGDEDWTDEEMEEVGRLYYQAYLDTIDALRPMLNNAKSRLKSRIEETKSKPNIELMLNQWREDKQWGRAVVWKDKHLEVFESLSPEQKAEFRAYEQAFSDVMNATDTAHLKRTQANASINGANRKIVYLFQQKNKDALIKLSESIAKYVADNNSHQWLYDLALGYIHVMNEEPASALDCFMSLDEKYLSEDEYQQMVGLALSSKQYDLAEAILGKMASIAEAYLPRYAALLRLNNKISDALNAYSDYLERNPSDVPTWLALGKLCWEIESWDSAEMAYNCVLASDPENKEALTFLPLVKEKLGAN